MKGDNESWPKIGFDLLEAAWMNNGRGISSTMSCSARRSCRSMSCHARRLKPSKRWSGAYLLVIELGQLPVKRLIQEL